MKRWLGRERRNAIASRLASDGRVIVMDLATEFGVTQETIRRDLQAIAETVDIRKVYGGALLRTDSVADTPFLARMHTTEKRKIAYLARPLIPDEGLVWLDGGTTVAALADIIDGCQDVTFVTHSLAAASNLARNPKFEGSVVLPGGDLDVGSQVLLGPNVHRLAERTSIDVAFLGANYLNAEAGCSTKAHREAELKTLVAEHSRTIVLLAESRKLCPSRGVRFLTWSQVHYWLTDDAGLPDTQRRMILQQGTRILTPRGEAE